MRDPYALSLLITSSLYEHAVIKDGCRNSNAAGSKSFENRKGNCKAVFSQNAAHLHDSLELALLVEVVSVGVLE